MFLSTNAKSYTKYRLIVITTNDNEVAISLLVKPFLNEPITRSDEVNVKTGRSANGNCRLINAFKPSFKLVNCSKSAENDKSKVGAIAIDLVSRTRFHFTQ